MSLGTKSITVMISLSGEALIQIVADIDGLCLRQRGKPVQGRDRRETDPRL